MSRLRIVFLTWFLIGAATGAILQFGQARVMGGVPEGLLFVGALEPVHELIVDQLPDTPVFGGVGHDGQVYYAMGLDLEGRIVPDVIGSAPYRYRRILFPALASGFGLLDGEQLLWGMIALASLSIGAAAGAVAALAKKLGLPAWAPVAVLLNPATWLSARLLTADNVALAFGLLAVLAVVGEHYRWAIVAIGLAALTKEPYLAFAFGLGGFLWSRGKRLPGITTALVPVAALLPWWIYIYVRIGNPFTSGSTLILPLAGVIDASGTWGSLDARDQFYLACALGSVACSMWIVSQRWDIWSWLVAPWLAIAVLSSQAVWQFGNNAIRAFGPLLTLGILALLSRHSATASEGGTVADGSPSFLRRPAAKS